MIPSAAFYAFFTLLLLLAVPLIAPAGKKIKLFMLSLLGAPFVLLLSVISAEKISAMMGKTSLINYDLIFKVMIVYALLAIAFAVYIRNRNS